MSKLHRHVAQSPETDHPSLLAFHDAPVSHGRVRCDSCAQERRYSGEIEIGRDAKDKVLFDDDAVRVTTVGDTSKVHVRRVVGKSHVGAELLKTSLTFRAGTVGVNQAADRSKVARLEFGNCRADLGDTANYLMAWSAGIDGGHHTPLITDLMEVRVADTAKEYRSERRLCPDRAEGSLLGQAEMLHLQRNTPSRCTGHVILS